MPHPNEILLVRQTPLGSVIGLPELAELNAVTGDLPAHNAALWTQVARQRAELRAPSVPRDAE